MSERTIHVPCQPGAEPYHLNGCVVDVVLVRDDMTLCAFNFGVRSGQTVWVKSAHLQPVRKGVRRG